MLGNTEEGETKLISFGFGIRKVYICKVTNGKEESDKIRENEWLLGMITMNKTLKNSKPQPIFFFYQNNFKSGKFKGSFSWKIQNEAERQWEIKKVCVFLTEG